MEHTEQREDSEAKKLEAIGIVTFPVAEPASFTPISNLVEVVGALRRNVVLLTGNEGLRRFKNDERVRTEGGWYSVGHGWGRKILYHILMQIRVTICLMRESRTIRTWIFFMGGDLLIAPILAARILGGEVLLVSSSSSQRIYKHKSDKRSLCHDSTCESECQTTPSRYAELAALISSISCALSNRIIAYSPNIVAEWRLERHAEKIRFAHEHFLTPQEFTMTKPYRDRALLVGYVGRLSEEKGALNFVRAIPLIHARRKDISFEIVGDGDLRCRVEESLASSALPGVVRLVGWVTHSELCTNLNELRLLVLPSYTEGLPNTMLEAMACGVPVLASPVGAIPDVIRHGDNGFLLESNSPRCIADAVVDIFEKPEIESVASMAQNLIQSQYSFEETVKKWAAVLESE